MLHAALRWLIPLGAFFVVGPLSALLAAGLHAVDGSGHATFFTADGVVGGAVALLIALGAALFAGVGASRVLGARSGMFAAGLVLSWSAYSTGPMTEVIVLGGKSVLPHVLLEGVVVAVAGVAIAWAALAIKPIAWPPDPAHPHGMPIEPRSIAASQLPIGLGAALVASGLVVYLIAQDTLPLQTLAAATFGGLFGAMAGRITAVNVSAAAFVAAVALLAVFGPIGAMLMHSGPRGPVDASLAGHLFFLARTPPMTYLAGALLGVPMGLSWADSIIHKHAPASA